MNQPHVSVIIPVFQPNSTLIDTVRSIQAQTHPHLEILIIDDGSTQSMPIEVSSIAQVHRLEINSGSPALPREVGLSHATGEWIAFCDADDLWHPTKLTQQLTAVHATPKVGAVATNANRVQPGVPVQKYFPQMPHTCDRADLMRNNLVITSSMMVRRNILMQCGSVPSSKDGIYEDLALWLRVASHTRIAFVDEPLVDYLDDPRVSHRSTYGTPLTTLFRTLKNNQQWSKQQRKRWNAREVAYAGRGLTRAAKSSARQILHSYSD